MPTDILLFNGLCMGLLLALLRTPDANPLGYRRPTKAAALEAVARNMMIAIKITLDTRAEKWSLCLVLDLQQ